jgi:hypothetical protein
MDITLINSISTISFFVVISFFVLISLMTAYVFIRYGQNKNLAIIMSLAFGGVFFLGALSAFISLQKLF